MVRQTWIVNSLYRRMSAEILRHSLGILRLRSQPNWQRPQAAKRQPAVERRGYRPPGGLEASDLGKETVFFVRNYRTAQQVTVATQVLRRRVHDQVDT